MVENFENFKKNINMKNNKMLGTGLKIGAGGQGQPNNFLGPNYNVTQKLSLC